MRLFPLMRWTAELWLLKVKDNDLQADAQAIRFS